MSMTFEAIQVIIVFVLPGFIIDRSMQLLPREEKGQLEYLLSLIAWSALNLALWSPLLYWLFVEGHLNVWTFAKWAPFIVVLSPVAIGFLGNLVGQKDLLGRMYGRIGLRTSRQMPSAWDEVFSRGEAYWVRVRLKDGTWLGGAYEEGSYVSGYPVFRDMYISTQYKLTDDGSFLEPVARSGGVWISGSEIAAIEFLTEEEAAHGQAA